jgi:hypothetical protein
MTGSGKLSSGAIRECRPAVTLTYAYRPSEPRLAGLVAGGIAALITAWLLRAADAPAAGWVALAVLWSVVIVRFGRTTVATVDRTRGELRVRTRILGMTIRRRVLALAEYQSVSVRVCPCPRFLEARIELTGAGAPPATAAVRYANDDGTVPAEVLAFAGDIADAAGLPAPRVE